MDSALCLTPDEARTYSKILDAVAVMPKSDPRFALIIGITWWLLHRRRRLEQQRIRRRQFFRRWRRLVLLRWQLQRNVLTGVSSAMKATELAGLEELTTIPEKRLWVKSDRTEDFWSKMDSGEISPIEFSKKFHMSNDTFAFIYNELVENLTKSNTSMREALPGKKRLAATIYRIANNAEYLKVASLFGIGKSTTTSLVRDVCDIIVQQLKEKYLNWSIADESLEEKIVNSEITFGIPQCVGVLSSMDIFIVGSSWNWSESSPYSSIYSKTHALAFQAVVDNNYKFTHVVAGSPAGLTNMEILQSSNLSKSFENSFGDKIKKSLNNIQVSPLLVGDPSYILENWLMTPYNLDNKSMETEDDVVELDKRMAFNEKISQAQTKFIETIKKLKNRWKIFHGKGGKISFNTDAFENIALTCCILHNICESRGDNIIESTWSTEIDDELLSLRILDENPTTTNSVSSTNIEINTNESSKEIRDALAGNIFDKRELLKCL